MMYKDEMKFWIWCAIIVVSFFCFLVNIIFGNEIIGILFGLIFVFAVLGSINISYDEQRTKDENEEYYKRMQNL